MEQLRRANRRCDAALRARFDRLRRAEAEVARIAAECDGLSGRALDPAGDRRAQGATSDKTARMALRLANARERVERCRAWVELANEISARLDETFDGDVFDLTLTDNLGDQAAARKLGVSRQRVIRSREATTQLCALLAAERGLLTIQDATKEGTSDAERR